jgi:acetyltransferase-like isoleucine patch superfamily enzyme
MVSMHVTPFTYSRDAVITIGDGTFLNGTRFGCAQEITVGERCILADARIMDTDFHSLHADRHDPAAPVRVKPVHIADNVWIGAQAGILPGTRIGRNSVVSFGAVCSGRYRADAVIIGNPGEAVMSIPGTPAADGPAAD